MKNNPKGVGTVNCKFVVSFSKVHLIFTVPIYLFFAAGGVNLFFRTNYLLVYLDCMIFAFVIAAVDLCATLCFSVKVYDTEILYRSHTCKRYRFKFSDILKMRYEKNVSGDVGNKYYLYLVTAAAPNKELKVDADMRNFDKLAAFLLEKMESGEIQPQAVSAYCKRELEKHRDGTCLKKNKNKVSSVAATANRKRDKTFAQKKKVPRTVYSETFGKMVRNGPRSVTYQKRKPEKLVLWGVKYEIAICTVQGTYEMPITPAQEASYRYFLDNRDAVLRQIEAAVEACQWCDKNVSTPVILTFDLNGGFGMNFLDREKLGVNDVDGAMFTVTVLPRVSVICGDFYWRKSTGVVK